MGVGACCPACGTQLRVAAKFCYECGAAVGGVMAVCRRCHGRWRIDAVRACLAALAIQGVEDVGVRLRVGLNSIRS